jgi:Flp pilus assembly protein TadG
LLIVSLVTEATKVCTRARVAIAGFFEDRRGIAATEFAVIVPIMLVMFFGTVEFSSGLTVDRKVSLVARAIANLTSQGTQATNSDVTNYFLAGNKIMTPYAAPNMTISELYIDPSSGNARVQWSSGYAPRSVSSVVPIPASLVGRNPSTNAINSNQYLILAEVSTLYRPAVGYVMAPSGVTLSDVAYAIPRQSTCVFYPSTPAIVAPATQPACPTS